ncbi:hypothetical protein [Intrasporangium sp.]|uniref:hypothetical protein n=1 Tax=Intrasporangium sp. TaxID=1925024 RepID=UPI00336532A9
MPRRTPRSSGNNDVRDPAYDALISLHAQTGLRGATDPGLIPGFHSLPTGEALRMVAAAPADQIPASARLGVLGDLARAGFPGRADDEEAYLELARSVDQVRIKNGKPIDPATLLTDLEQALRDRVPFYKTHTGGALEHQEAALVGEDVCTVRTVEVGGLEATSIYAEFHTNAPFETVAEWIDPRSWPRRGPMLFKRMTVVDAAEPVALGPPGSPHWHGVFHEEVQLLQRVNTLLHCDFWRQGNEAAGMTYDLSLSLDNEIDVDRGFLLVTNAGGDLTVKALKIVGFRLDVWDTVAGWVCPSWTDFVRAAAEGGTESSAYPASGGHIGPPGRSPLGETFDAWVEFLGDSARAYVDLFEDVTTRVSTKGVSAAECLDDERKLWSRLAKDWSQAWTHGMSTLEEVSREGLDAGFMPPGVPPDRGRGAARTMTSGAPAGPPVDAAEGTIIQIPGLGPSVRLRVSDLVSIEAGGAMIRAGAVRVSVEQLAQGQYGVHLDVSDPTAAAGLYVGELMSADGTMRTPIQLYVSRATGA